MKHEFWHARWERNEIAFHEGTVNVLLERHLDALALPPGSRLFLPLCGKTRDIAWLLDRGLHVVGAELSALAIEQLFSELGAVATVTGAGALRRHCAQGLTILQGDIFDMRAGDLGRIDAVYDRAALVALPGEMRAAYCSHLTDITEGAPQLVVTFEYDATRMQGPPFSVTEEEVRLHYGNRTAIRVLERRDVPGGLRGRLAAAELAVLVGR